MRSPLEYFALALTMDGVDEEVGSTDELGWYGLVNAPVIPSVTDMDPALRAMWNDLEPQDQKALQTQKGGAIVEQDSQGFVNVSLYDNDEDLNDAWDAIVDDVSPEDEED